MNKVLYLVDIEFRYSDWLEEEDRPTNRSKTVTIGVYDTYKEAQEAGNEMLEKELETRFSLNKHWNKKERFGERYTKYLITDMTYLNTPFQFFAHIKELRFDSVSEVIEEVLNSETRYKKGKVNSY